MELCLQSLTSKASLREKLSIPTADVTVGYIGAIEITLTNIIRMSIIINIIMSSWHSRDKSTLTYYVLLVEIMPPLRRSHAAVLLCLYFLCICFFLQCMHADSLKSERIKFFGYLHRNQKGN